MKRFAYLLANNDGLPGVKKDVEDFRRFLESCRGGAWKSNEIVRRYNTDLKTLSDDLSAIRQGLYDYVVFYYSGHGDWKRETRLYINEHEDYICESSISGLAQRQLSIFDCCRVVPQAPFDGLSEVCDAFANSASSSRDLSRARFDRLVMAASPQELKLYACQCNQCAITTGNGSVYTQALIETAMKEGERRDFDAVSTHDVASPIASSMAAALGHLQLPDRRPSGMVLHALPFAIRPSQLIRG